MDPLKITIRGAGLSSGTAGLKAGDENAKDGFRVSGRILNEKGDPHAGLLVRAYDKDVIVDDHLGDAISDEAGEFAIAFTKAAFQDVREQNPDLYLRVFTTDGKRELMTTLGAVRRNASEEEFFELHIPADIEGS